MNCEADPILFLQCRPAGKIADNEAETLAALGNLKIGQSLERVMLVENPDLMLTTGTKIDFKKYAAVVISGSPFDALSTGEQRMDQQIRLLATEILDRQIPTLGICFGMQILSLVLGGRLNRDHPENLQPVTTTLTESGKTDPLTGQLPSQFQAFTGHSDALTDLPGDTVCLGTGDFCPYQLVRFTPDIYGCQFHPEIDWPGMQLRIKTYGGHYCPIAEVPTVTQRCAKADVSGGNLLVTKFVERYRIKR